MSELRGTDPTAGGDASVVEKTDCDVISLSTVELKCCENEASSASSSNVQTETKIEGSEATINEEAANSNAAEIAHAEDAEESKVENLNAIALRRNEETSQSGFDDEEKVKKEKRNRIILFYFNFVL